VCFSPEADLVGGAVIAAIGIDALRHVQKRHGHVAIAALPLLLAAHQLDESLVWLGLQGHVPHGVEHVAVWIYLLVAFVVLPIFVPAAVLAFEPTRRRKWSMAPFVALGLAVAGILAHAMVRDGFSASIRPYHIAYSLHMGDALAVIVCYVVAVCGALLFSGDRHVVIFGLVNLLAIVVIARLTVDGFASVWCGWAAVSSGAIAAHLRFAHPHRSSPYRLAA
jgi:hypothetical protein